MSKTGKDLPQQEIVKTSRFEDFVTVDQFVSENPNLLTKSQLSWIMRNRRRNGLAKSGAVKIISGKFYLVRPNFYEWIDGQSA